MKCLLTSFRYLLLPIAWLYGSIVWLHKTWHRRLLGAYQLKDCPSIGIGNLSVGGTGKSPHVAYLAAWLLEQQAAGIVSRGYGRRLKDPQVVTLESSATSVGDEPLQLKQQVPDATVVVAAQRKIGMHLALQQSPKPAVILLDDVLQHWQVIPSLSILLSTFEAPFFNDWLLPVGRLRQAAKAYQQADVLIITKCPPNLSVAQRQAFLKQLPLMDPKAVFFSFLAYSSLYPLGHPQKQSDLQQLKQAPILLLTGIATPKPLYDFVRTYQQDIHQLSYPDHHNYSSKDLYKIQQWAAGRQIITTEKDATKLQALLTTELAKKTWVLPVKVQFEAAEESRLKARIQQHLASFQLLHSDK